MRHRSVVLLATVAPRLSYMSRSAVSDLQTLKSTASNCGLPAVQDSSSMEPTANRSMRRANPCRLHGAATPRLYANTDVASPSRSPARASVPTMVGGLLTCGSPVEGHGASRTTVATTQDADGKQPTRADRFPSSVHSGSSSVLWGQISPTNRAMQGNQIVRHCGVAGYLEASVQHVLQLLLHDASAEQPCPLCRFSEVRNQCARAAPRLRVGT